MRTKSVPAVGVEAPALLDVRRVAVLLGCSERTVQRLVDAGEVPPPVQVGRLVRWRRTDVDEWVENRRSNNVPQRRTDRSRIGERDHA